MAPQITTRSWVLVAAALLAGGCQRPPDRGTDSYITGLRVMAIQANPPEVNLGQTTALSVLAVDTQGRQVDVAWAYCTAASSRGGQVNDDCITKDSGDFLTPFDGGLSAMFNLPANFDTSVLGDADQTGGVYLPLRAKITAGTDSYTAIYSLRIGLGSPPPTPNQNPVITGLYQVLKGSGDGMDGSPSDGGSYSSGADLVSPIDAMPPLPVHTGDKLTLRALFSAASTESYTTVGRTTDAGTSMRTNKERLSLSFYSTAGTIGRVMNAGTTTTDGGTGTGGGGGMGGFGGGATPDTALTLDSNLPASGGTIDLWVVGRDNRGGTDFVHRTLVLQ